MKPRVLNLAVLLALLPAQLLWAQPALTPPSGPGSASPSGAHIQFATPVYDFGKVSAGEQVKYQFVFTNTGDALLTLSDVHPGCGCTTAGDWSKQVEPGKTGIIPIQFNSSAYTGPVVKTVTVTCNDKAQPTIGLQIKGTIWKAIEVTPQNAVLNLAAESSADASAVVRIVNNLDQPITLSAPECNNKAFTAELKTIQPGKEFQLIVKAAPSPAPGNLQGVITIKTSSTNLPVINVMTFAMVQPTIVASPPQVYLSAAPLGNSLTTVVSIRNNGTNLVALSDASVNAPGVEAAVKETEPGRLFSVTLTFPSGFAAPAGALALTVKTSHPKYPVITVPIQQSPRPMAVANKWTPPAAGQTNPPPREIPHPGLR